MSVQSEIRDGIAVLSLDNPPVNGLGLATRRGLVEALEAAQQDQAVRAIVITGGGRSFSGGADIREFDTPPAEQEPTLPTVIRACPDRGIWTRWKLSRPTGVMRTGSP
mgnify:CR=1 FL=1